MINCYVVVTRGTVEKNPKVAAVATCAMGPLTAARLGTATIFMTTSDRKLASKVAKEIGGRLCRLMEEVE